MNPIEIFFAQEKRHLQAELRNTDHLLPSERENLVQQLEIVNQLAEHAQTPGDILFEIQYQLGAAEQDRTRYSGLDRHLNRLAKNRVFILRNLYQELCEVL